MIPTDAIVIRLARDADAPALHRLAALDSRPPLAGPALLAEVDGSARAALDLADGSVVADPFARTASLVALLRLRAQSLQARETRRRPRPPGMLVRGPRRAI